MIKNLYAATLLALTVTFIGAPIIMVGACGNPKTVADVASGIGVAACVLEHSTDPVSQIVKACAGSTEAFVTTVLSKHRAATVRETSKDATYQDAGK